ncbi:glycosyltransferase [Nostoc sp. CMAA1605]|uniref:glycosyltransferase n=1 Tax=Nostoc sp. CMAA1605 TaxID=2055159 RepID=UPI001F295739|nr:glycosyltransferase [Nostoc sp. CMAA1605]MCF4967338.1 hypothetical protein [Nostoc sp. CMAA1605]
MKVAIDIQALQTKDSRNRGIGRYTQSVLESLFNQHNSPIFELYANATLSEPSLNRNLFPYNSINYPYIGSCKTNDLLLKTTLTSSDADIVLIPSPMEGLECTIPNYTNFSKKIFVICYDLIPFIFSDRYLNDENVRSLYMKRLKNVQNADFIFSISESTRQDLIKHLNIEPDKVLNVSGGVSSFFTPISISEHSSWLKTFGHQFGIHKKFILYTGGEDWRKNIEGLVTAFSKLPKHLREDYQLVIACKVSNLFATEIRNLAARVKISQSLILTNYITDEELRALYSTCSLFVFPSFYEGFGLPLLEAISCGAPAIASNNSSLPEIVGSSEQLFDPHSPHDIARSMQTVLLNEEFRLKITENALYQAAQFSWQSVAQKMLDVFQEHQPLNRISICFNRIKTSEQKPQIAFFSPFPPAKSGIADYSQDLVPSLQQYCNLDLYEDGYLLEADVVNRILPHTKFEAKLESQGYEGIIYQIGNSSYHCNMFSKLMRYSGISVLHDYYLGGLINYMDTQCPELGVKLSQELEHCYGTDKGTELFKLIKRGKLNIHKKLPEEKIYLNRRVFTRSIGVVLHSKWACNRAIKEFEDDNHNIIHIPQLVPEFVCNEESFTLESQSLGIPDDSFIVAAFGFISSTKRPLEILHAFKKYITNQPKAYLVFVGGTDYVGSINIEREIEKLGLGNQVKITGYVSMSDFYRYIEISDICLNLRYPFNGESSASLLRILSVGKPTVVTDIGSFADFPDNVVHKIPQPHHSDEVNEIVKALILLTENEEYRHSLSHNSSEYIAKEHSPERCARLYSDFIQQVIKSPQAKQKLLTDYVGRELAKLDTSISNSVLAYFVKNISANDT